MLLFSRYLLTMTTGEKLTLGKFTFLPIPVLEVKIKAHPIVPFKTFCRNSSQQTNKSPKISYDHSQFRFDPVPPDVQKCVPRPQISSTNSSDKPNSKINSRLSTGTIFKPMTDLSYNDRATSILLTPNASGLSELEDVVAGKNDIDNYSNHLFSDPEPDIIKIDSDSENDAETADTDKCTKSLWNRDINTCLYSSNPTSTPPATALASKADEFYDLPDGYDFDYEHYVKHLHDSSQQKSQSPRFPSTSLSVASLGGKSPILSPKLSLNSSHCSPSTVSKPLPPFKNPPIMPPNLSRASIDFSSVTASAVASASTSITAANTKSSSSPRSSSDAGSAREEQFTYSGRPNDGDSKELNRDFEFSSRIKMVFRLNFGLREFRKNQLPAINAALLKLDTFIIMPTGSFLGLSTSEFVNSLSLITV